MARDDGFQFAHRLHRLLLRIVLGSALLPGCASFAQRWGDANNSQFPTNDVSGIWVGPWRNDSTGRRGTVRLIVNQSPTGGYEAHMQMFIQHPLLPHSMTSADYPWVREIPFFATPTDENTFNITSRFHFTWPDLLDPDEYVCQGTADGSEINGTFQHGAETGRIRLRRINPCPEQWSLAVPGVIVVTYNPPALREQIAQAEDLELNYSEPSDTIGSSHTIVPAAHESPAER